MTETILYLLQFVSCISLIIFCAICIRIEMKRNKLIDNMQVAFDKSKYKALVNFIEMVSHESVYEKFENLNELNMYAFELLQKIKDKE